MQLWTGGRPLRALIISEFHLVKDLLDGLESEAPEAERTGCEKLKPNQGANPLSFELQHFASIKTSLRVAPVQQYKLEENREHHESAQYPLNDQNEVPHARVD